MDYTNMSAYYDVIMTSGYYDYPGIVDSLLSHRPVQNVIEIGCGTGLILEEIAKREPSIRLKGIDLTQAMLDIADQRLKGYKNIQLSCQNVVDFELHEQFDVAYSYGGVWYFVIDGDKEPFMVSHIADHALNVRGLYQLAQHLKPQGQLLLGIQGPHFDYEKTISNGMTYAQEIIPSDIGFVKHYHLLDQQKEVMAQTVNYRTYSFQDAQEMLGVHGIEYVSKDPGGKFLRFQKR
ncbi:MAG: class I SAM-dependent methyltransferase [Burkholderiaceae bacterium]